MSTNAIAATVVIILIAIACIYDFKKELQKRKRLYRGYLEYKKSRANQPQ